MGLEWAMRTDLAQGERLLMKRDLKAPSLAEATVKAIRKNNGGLLVIAYLPPGVEVGDCLIIRRENCDSWPAVFQQMIYKAAFLIGAEV